MNLTNLKYTSSRKNFTVKFDSSKQDPRAFVVVNNFRNTIVARYANEHTAWSVAKEMNLSN